jgi:hypothetical protein
MIYCTLQALTFYTEPTPSTTTGGQRQTVQREYNASTVNQAPSGVGFTSADIAAITEDIPTEPPPDYTPGSNPPPQARAMQAAELNARLTQLETTLAVKNKGRLMIRPYTAAQQIDSVQLLYVGLTREQLTTREVPLPSYIHPTHSTGISFRCLNPANM